MIFDLCLHLMKTAGQAIVFCLLPIIVTHISVADEREEYFEKYVRPLLLDRCVECHGPQKQEQDLRLDRREAVLEGSISDIRIVKPGAPAESRLLQVLAYSEDDTQMPPASKLPEEQLAILHRWIADGAIWPESADLESEAMSRAERWRDHWAFRKPVQPDLSTLPSDLNPVDFLIQQQLAEKQLTPSPMADPRTLVRRLSYALTGLPPQLIDNHSIDKAAADGTLKQWLAEYTDRLLASPHFGERWGRYWLDIARYADTKGYVFQEDREYPEAWKYREWVIKALNDDLPYNEFLKRQLSADRLSGSEDGANLAAMGFLTLGRRFLNNKHDIIDDRIDVTIRGMMGLTASCARCHDHKFDPIPTADYYSLYGVFDSSDEPKNEPSTLRLVDREKPVQPVIFLRGQPGNRGEAVPRRFLTALSADTAAEFTEGSGRLELANAIASDQNPLTGRVAVNRIWMRLFGRGLVDSPSDFGVRTDPPTHPELLDYLTLRFIEDNWSTKLLIRLLVTSSTWQQSSAERPDTSQADPENRLLARMPRRRLDFEAHRDSLLEVSGQLNSTVGGPSVDITTGGHGSRRTIYARIDRQNLPGIFRTFDLASPDAHASQRFETTVPQQALYQLNNAFVMEQAEAIAVRVTAASSGSPTELQSSLESQISRLFQHILRREPAAAESQAAKEFLNWFDSQQNSTSGRSGWAYGYGTLDEATAQVTQFTRMPHFQKGSWQGGKELPDPALGWLMLNRGGGHVGDGLSRCAIRRFVTDINCDIQISGQLAHSSEHGNGVRGRVVSSAGGVLADSTVHNSKAQFELSSIALRAGDAVDFVVDDRGDTSFDSFDWPLQLIQSVNGNVIHTWNSSQDFGRKQSQPLLTAWAQLAQTLLLTNEFVFLD